jgi:glycerol-3-phosphate acyltransferase PlsY
MTFLVILIISFLIGSIPWGFIISQLYGVNIQKVGSGNIGATNVYRVLGLPTGILVGLLDLLKGSLVAAIALLSFNNQYMIAATILSVVLGHIFSVFLKGRGGKGVGTAYGALIVLIGWKVMLAMLLIWVAVTLITQYVSLSSLIMAAIIPFYFLLIRVDFPYFLLAIALAVLIFWTHRSNIKRLRAGKELKLDIHIGYKRQKHSRTAAGHANVMNAKEVATTKRPVGRPPKVATPQKRKVGRPRKS